MKTIKYDNFTFNVEHISGNEYKLLEVMDGERSLPGIPFQRRFGIDRDYLKHDDEDKKEYDAADAGAVVGIASSTSVDSYGTEMSRAGLETMASQFEQGVPLTPRHNGDQGAVEWDEVIGETYKANIERVGAVAKAADESEEGYVLRVWSKLYETEPKAKALARRLGSKQPIGMSIGGWFVDARMVTGSDDEVERIIIDNVLLDHLAITRRPANPDSVGLDLARSLGNAISRCKEVDAPGVQPTETRSEMETTMENTQETESTVEELLADVVELANEVVAEERTEEVVEETTEEVVEEADAELEERAEEVETEEAEEQIVETEEAEEAAEEIEEDEIVENEEACCDDEACESVEEVEDDAPEADEEPAEEPADEPAEEGRNEMLDVVMELRNTIEKLNERIAALEAPAVEEEPVVEEIERSEPNLESQVEELKAQVEELEALPQPKAELPTVGRSEADAPKKEDATELTAKVDYTNAHYDDLSSALSALLAEGVEAGVINTFKARE